MICAVVVWHRAHHLLMTPMSCVAPMLLVIPQTWQRAVRATFFPGAEQVAGAHPGWRVSFIASDSGLFMVFFPGRLSAHVRPLCHAGVVVRERGIFRQREPRNVRMRIASSQCHRKTATIPCPRFGRDVARLDCHQANRKVGRDTSLAMDWLSQSLAI